MPRALKNASPIFLREQDKLTARLASVMSHCIIPKRKRAQGRACKPPSSQSSSGMTQEVNRETPSHLDGQRPGRSMGKVSGVPRIHVTHHPTCQRTGHLDRTQAALHDKEYNTDLGLTR